MEATKSFQSAVSGRSADTTEPFWLQVRNSYERIGLARGAGSLDASRESNVPGEAGFVL
jgi:hypothetical protein